LAQITSDVDHAGVVGADRTAEWFAEHAANLGVKFEEPIPQRIHALQGPPRYPEAPGSARVATAEDAALLFEWLSAFQREAVPHDPPPGQADAQQGADSGRYFFWICAGEPVSVAAISRRLRRSGAIAPVYTPIDQRGRGYGGSVTAAAADRIIAEGKTPCLYTDLRNPASNRCYARIGFAPYCDSWHYPRVS
jgi:predicted GNAT family acetyltransferase